MSVLDIYTDGSCRNNGHCDARAGYGVYFGPQDSRNTYGKLSKQYLQNSINAELMAIYNALQLIQREIESIERRRSSPMRYNINIDCTEALRLITRRQKSRYSSTNEFVKDCLEMYHPLKNECLVQFSLVKGHSGIQGNEMADALAVMGSVLPE